MGKLSQITFPVKFLFCIFLLLLTENSCKKDPIVLGDENDLISLTIDESTIAVSYNPNNQKIVLTIPFDFDLSKNIGQYNIAIGEEKNAIRILTIALKKAIDLELNGQIIQIQNLINSISSSNENQLITYKMKKK